MPGLVEKKSLATGWFSIRGSCVLLFLDSRMIPDATHWQSLSLAAASRHFSIWFSLHSSSSSKIATQQSLNRRIDSKMPTFQLMALHRISADNSFDRRQRYQDITCSLTFLFPKTPLYDDLTTDARNFEN